MQNADIPLILSSLEADKAAYNRIIAETAQAILDSFQDEKAYVGPVPGDLKALVHTQELLPERGLGFEVVLERMKHQILPNVLRTWSTDYMPHLHSPALMESIAAELVIATFNQSMDSWDQGPVATEIEVEVIRHLCQLYGFGESSDGVFTSGGSQSNLCAITLARDWYCNTHLHYDIKKRGLPDCYSRFRFYTSEISHFSMEKSTHMLGLGYDAVVKVPVDKNCKMDVSALQALIDRDKSAGLIPVGVVATIGTTDYGSIDNVDEIAPICKENGMWLHADAAYGSGVRLSARYSDRIGNLWLCDSITVDFHKMFLLPISCSALLVKDGSTLDVFMLHADYLNREEDEEDGYTNLVGKSIQTTRRFDALKVWVAFQVRGKDGFGEIIDTCIGNASYLYGRLCADDAFEVAVEPEISSVVFRLNASDDANKQVRRRLLHQQGIIIGQTVYCGRTFLKFTLLNPMITHEKLDELMAMIKELGK